MKQFIDSKILVTGSSGHLGQALCLSLKNKGIDYVGIDIKSGPYTTHVGNITEVEFLKDLFQNVNYVMHAATLHKPHIVTHTKQEFVDTNVTGTLNLLEQARLNKVLGFIFTSTTSTFGDVLRPPKTDPAVWVDETTASIPKNIYGISKTTAEDLCQIYFRNHDLPCLILRTSRFFLEEDDKKELRELYEDPNIKANEYLFKRVDIEDVVSAHLLALDQVRSIGFRKYIISATSPFKKGDLMALHTDAHKTVSQYYQEFEEIYAARNWKMFPQIERVYVNQRARTELDWKPKYDFKYILNCLKENKDFRSPLAAEIGIIPYHNKSFEVGPYPVIENK